MTALLSAAVAAACGVLSGMGVGGGSLLLVWLTVAAGFSPAAATAYNLLYFLCCAPFALFSHWRQGNLDLRTVLISLAGALPAALAARWLAAVVQGMWLDRAFALFLLAMGMREVLAKKQ